MSIPSVQPIPFPVSSSPFRSLGAAAALERSRRMAIAPAPAAPAPASDAENARWRAELGAHAAGIDTLLEAAATRMGIPLAPAAREAIVWRALGEMDAAVREVAVHKGKRAFLATLGAAPRLSVVDDAVRAGIDAYEARLALGRIR